jgi:hypothetical protein
MNLSSRADSFRLMLMLLWFIKDFAIFPVLELEILVSLPESKLMFLVSVGVSGKSPPFFWELLSLFMGL